MTIRKLVYLPDACLRTPAKPVDAFDADLQILIDDMFETMYNARGVGLAAPQIGISLQLAVMDVTPDKSKQYVIINPEILEKRGEASYQEGCLSVPGAYDTVKRAEWVSVKALDRHGEPFELSGDGVLGECIQHEIEHLQGKLFIDLLSAPKRDKARKTMNKTIKAMKRDQ